MVESNNTRILLVHAAAAIVLAAAAFPLQALATQSANKAGDSKVLGGIERGADAAGRGIERAGNATKRGVDNTAERASAPVRRWGESLGRKLSPRSGAAPSSPSVGPQGNAP